MSLAGWLNCVLTACVVLTPTLSLGECYGVECGSILHGISAKRARLGQAPSSTSAASAAFAKNPDDTAVLPTRSPTSSPTESPRPTPKPNATPRPRPTQAPLPPFAPAPTPPPAPSGGSGAGSGAAIAGAVLGLLGGSSGIFGAGSPFGGGANASHGAGTDAYGGTGGNSKFYEEHTTADEYLEALEESAEEQEQRPGSVNRVVKCFPEDQADQLAGPGDLVISAEGPDGNISNGGGVKISQNLSANYPSYGGQVGGYPGDSKGSTTATGILGAVYNSAAGLALKPTPNGLEPRNTVILNQCHGSPDGAFYMGPHGSRVHISELNGAIAAGKADASAAGRTPGKITYISGCCYPRDAPAADHFATLADPNQPNYFSNGTDHIIQHIVPTTTDGIFTLQDLKDSFNAGTGGGGSVRKTQRTGKSNLANPNATRSRAHAARRSNSRRVMRSALVPEIGLER